MEYFLIAFAYFTGSIPFGLILMRIFNQKDIRTHGSGNIGATNVLRVGGKNLGILTLILDIIKGVVPILLAKYLYNDQLITLYCGFAVILGHIFPIWLKFNGGKGVATFIAATICIDYNMAIVFILVWSLVFCVSRISALSSIIALLSMPVYNIIAYTNCAKMTFFTILAIIIVYKHKSNIVRMIKGKEQTINLNKR